MNTTTLLDIDATVQAAYDTLTKQTPHVKRPTPVLNKIYFNKKTPYDPLIKSLPLVTDKIWNIPFSADVDIPVSELTQRIDKVMEATKKFKMWKINFSTFEIIASEDHKLQ